MEVRNEKKQLLVVGADQQNWTGLQKILQDEYSIEAVTDEKEAMEYLSRPEKEVSVVLLDIRLSKERILGFLEELHKEKTLAVIPVLIITNEANELEVIDWNGCDYIVEPYRPEALKHRIATLVRQKENNCVSNQFKYDKLTGLYTKEYFYDKVREKLDEFPEKEFSIVSCNVENFKLYNDTYGREAGDRLLMEEAEVLKKRAPKGSICGRYTADRFLCLMDREKEKIGREYFIRGRQATRSELKDNVVVKLGVYEITKRDIPVELMCDRALWMLDTIKGRYDCYVAVYDDTLRNQLLREQAITDAMERALSEEQFTVYFQPKYNLHDGTLIGAEALVRWVHPEWGFISPGEFIPLFEKNGFISQLDSYVWEYTCKKQKEWQKKGYGIVPVSVNVSRIDVYHTQLVEHFCQLVKTYCLDPAYLHLEITESAYTENPEQLMKTVKELRRQGFVIEMDDFGSGYSSLNMLGQMSVDVLKLDMGFIRSEMAKPIEQSILNDIINMAHRMHLNIIAEGVETPEQKNRLTELGCDHAQGYFYAKPLPEEEFELLVARNTEKGKATEQTEIEAEGDHKRAILIVEDNEINREMLSEILEEYYTVLTAENGKEGLAVLRKNSRSITAILLDIQMPVMDGYEFLEEIRKNTVFNRIPVIVTSSMNSQEEEQRCIQLGAADFLEKPYNFTRLMTRIENLVHLKTYDSMVAELQTDALTGFKNRKMYYEDVALLEQEADRITRPLGILFADINGLKLVNDKNGHKAGDKLILDVSSTLRSVFSGADCYRLGGDEFVVFSFEDSKEEFEKKLELLEQSWKEGRSAAVGSVWVERIGELEHMVALADQNMYRNKSHFYEVHNHTLRRPHNNISEDMLRKVDEISELLPGGFFIYKADETGEIVSFNSEMVRLFQCADREEFKQLTGNTFEGMIYPEDRELVQQKIKEQIHKENDMDYVTYRIVCKDGTRKTVRDYGRFIHTELYGDVYYVFLNEK